MGCSKISHFFWTMIPRFRHNGTITKIIYLDGVWLLHGEKNHNRKNPVPNSGTPFFWPLLNFTGTKFCLTPFDSNWSQDTFQNYGVSRRSIYFFPTRWTAIFLDKIRIGTEFFCQNFSCKIFPGHFPQVLRCTKKGPSAVHIFFYCYCVFNTDT